MRGKQSKLAEFCARYGITPAHAGKTVQAWASLAKNEDHPRACGENGVIGVKKIYAQGSPPRMRGKLKKAISHIGFYGITPAHAGKTALTLGTDPEV